MNSVIRVEDAVTLDSPIFIDMRSPEEYAVGHIPGAVNIPLFNDDERAKVGTIYKQMGAEEAKHLGLSIVSTKLPDIVGQARQLHKSGRKVVVYCWRGGMRSKSIVNVLEMMGIAASQLLGGFKAYRQYVLDRLKTFEVKPVIVVLCGSTGTGKTIILNLLAQQNIPVIDLEKLANHRGSVFGQIGLGKPSTAQNFDAKLLMELDILNDQPYIVVECESKRIGNVYLPDSLFNAMRQGKKILLSTNIEIRVDRLIEEYLDIYSNNQEAIIASIESLRKRIGNKKTDQLLVDFNAGKIRDVVKILLLDYYDPMYGYEKAETTNYDSWVKADDVEQATDAIIQYLQQFGR
ncbi:tRNA 2-selenouridine(34) synthase MnmH [Sporomusa malonica]|uniref:tRNA 2-selenouridine synthase n=1 Tax=Sporomusa malonica TaxID=112901 RepID=A0A1W2AVS0_9FIRM|nr:tRNA 2-selenouridine(34) synthase MnmH [Sporomusa malonica]SMC64786.1 tRNA 2-selenouridine synthase [Sporomusa malonica]